MSAIDDPITRKKVSVVVSKVNHEFVTLNPITNKNVKFLINEIIAKVSDRNDVQIHFHWELPDDTDHSMFVYNKPTSPWGPNCEENIVTMVDLSTNNQDSNGIVKLFRETIHGAEMRRTLSNVMTDAWGMKGTVVDQYILDETLRPFCTLATIDHLKPAMNLRFDPRRLRSKY